MADVPTVSGKAPAEPGDKPASGVLQAVPVTIIGTMADTVPKTGTIATTPGAQQPNLVVTVITPLAAILIRFANSYLTMLVGLVTAGMASDIIPATDFVHLVGACAKLSLAGAGLGLLKDCVTIFGRLEQRFPLSSGSV